MTMQVESTPMAKRDWQMGASPEEAFSPPRVANGIYARAGKRLFDLFFAVAILPIVLPVIALFVILIRIEGKPSFYAHKRVGRMGREFNCYKLRTMRIDADEILARLCAEDPQVAAEWATYQKLTNDPRITPIGRFLRATSLDELPQLFNVFTGDMSFVGPRPYTLDQHDMYVAAGGEAYEHLRPGITGIWQVGERNGTTFGDRARFDNDYGARLSFGLDIALILRTAGAVLRRTGH